MITDAHKKRQTGMFGRSNKIRGLEADIIILDDLEEALKNVDLPRHTGQQIQQMEQDHLDQLKSQAASLSPQHREELIKFLQEK